MSEREQVVAFLRLVADHNFKQVPSSKNGRPAKMEEFEVAGFIRRLALTIESGAHIEQVAEWSREFER